jgi:hypothetical protein
MNSEFPYQLTTFLDKEPAIGEPVYYGENGWYPQIALKRRFMADGITEDELLVKMAAYFSTKGSFEIKTGALMQPERMPVKVLEVAQGVDLINFHNEFISFLGKAIKSKHPERDGANYLPHVTAEYGGKMVIDDKKYANRTFDIKRIYLLKDSTDENSVAYKSFDL